MNFNNPKIKESAEMVRTSYFTRYKLVRKVRVWSDFIF